MYRMFRLLILLLALAILVATALCGCALSPSEQIYAESEYIPLWMQPNSVIIYDENADYTVSQGGKLTDADIEGRDDIKQVGFTSTDPEMLAEPNIKVEYDLHGFIQNIYYATPGKPGQYQLTRPTAED